MLYKEKLEVSILQLRKEQTARPFEPQIKSTNTICIMRIFKVPRSFHFFFNTVNGIK